MSLSHGLRLAGRLVLAALLLTAGVAHFAAVEEFLGQVPTFLPAREAIVLVSGVVELVLGACLLASLAGPVLRGPRLALLGWVLAAFFVAVFPGNIWQAVHDSDSFGLDTDRARLIRLAFQPLLVALALWSTGAWASWRRDGWAGLRSAAGR